MKLHNFPKVKLVVTSGIKMDVLLAANSELLELELSSIS